MISSGARSRPSAPPEAARGRGARSPHQL